MAKDIIFMDKPPITLAKIARTHLKLDETIEKMKNMIQCATTVRGAFAILSRQFPFANTSLICEAIRESFGLCNKDVLDIP